MTYACKHSNLLFMSTFNHIHIQKKLREYEKKDKYLDFVRDLKKKHCEI